MACEVTPLLFAVDTGEATGAGFDAAFALAFGFGAGWVTIGAGAGFGALPFPPAADRMESMS